MRLDRCCIDVTYSNYTLMNIDIVVWKKMQISLGSKTMPGFGESYSVIRASCHNKVKRYLAVIRQETKAIRQYTVFCQLNRENDSKTKNLGKG